MSKMKNKFATYLCDFCKNYEIHQCEESGERLEDGRDCCINCLVKIKNEALALIRDCAYNWDCDSDSHKYGTPCRECRSKKFLKKINQ